MPTFDEGLDQATIDSLTKDAWGGDILSALFKLDKVLRANDAWSKKQETDKLAAQKAQLEVPEQQYGAALNQKYLEYIQNNPDFLSPGATTKVTKTGITPIKLGDEPVDITSLSWLPENVFSNLKQRYGDTIPASKADWFSQMYNKPAPVYKPYAPPSATTVQKADTIQGYTDQVKSEHPDWTKGQISIEVDKRMKKAGKPVNMYEDYMLKNGLINPTVTSEPAVSPATPVGEKKYSAKLGKWLTKGADGKWY